MNSRLHFVFIVNLFLCIFAQKELFEGDDCDLPHNEQGICVRVSLCPTAIEIVQQKQQPKKCGFVRSIPIVCCPRSQAKITRLAEQKCQIFQGTVLGVVPSNPSPNNKAFLPSFSNSNPSVPNGNFEATVREMNNHSGLDQRYDSRKPEGNNKSVHDTPPIQHTPSIISKRQIVPDNDTLSEEFQPTFRTFVIGGVNAAIREFPHMAALGYTNNKQKLWLCGGSLVSEKYVLTAAHCLASKDYGPLEWVRLGELNLASSIDEYIPQDYRVINKIAHPLYKPPSVYHDIALVELDYSIDITNSVKPACLFTPEYIPSKVQLLATGWGLTNVGGKQSDILQKVDLDLFSDAECDETYRSIARTRRLKNGVLHGQQICAGGRTEEKDTCQGDSGGPLQIEINDEDGKRFYIVGVTSFGRSCGIPNIPGIYTKVSYYIPWIENVLWPNEKY